MSQRFAKTALAFWVLAASTCGAVAHAHDGGDRPHSHHFGLVALRAPASSSGSARFAGLHRHLVVCGVETGNLPANPSGEDGSPPSPSNGPQVAVGFGTIQLDIDGPSDPVQPILADVSIDLSPVFTVPHSLPSLIASVPESHSTCAKVTHTRSGVQLV